MVSFRSLKRFTSWVSIASFVWLLNGCWVAVPMAVVGGVHLYNAARDQYPDIDFESQAPVKVTYWEKQDRVWDALVDTLLETGEIVALVNKGTGIIATEPRNFNDISWVDKGLGIATYRYTYSLVCTNSSVKMAVKFTEEKVFNTVKEKTVPEGSNMMRHILFDNLDKKLTRIAEEFEGNAAQ